MNSLVVFKVHNKYELYIIKKMIDHKIDIIKSYKVDDYIYYYVSLLCYNLLLKLDYKKVIIFERYTGYNLIKEYIRKNIEKLIISFSIVIIIFISKLLIINVRIKTSDISLKKFIEYSLSDYRVKNFSIKKSFNNIEKIKEYITIKYKDDIEWMEIKKDGYDYVVEVIKRKHPNNGKNYDYCNYIATKSGTIKNIIVRKGVLLVQENNFVNAGDTLISGEVIYNDEIKNKICASGKITGEVWYKVNVSYPLKKTITKKNAKGLFNIKIKLFNKSYQLFKSKHNKNKTIIQLGTNMINLSFIKTINEKQKIIKYKEEDAVKNAKKIAKKKLLQKLGKNAIIIDENILKKSINNDKIYLEILLIVEEELGKVENVKMR